MLTPTYGLRIHRTGSAVARFEPHPSGDPFTYVWRRASDSVEADMAWAAIFEAGGPARARVERAVEDLMAHPPCPRHVKGLACPCFEDRAEIPALGLRIDRIWGPDFS